MVQGHSLNIIDVNEAAFAQAVIEQSHKTPVVVDFWAPWCGPCRTLGPILERLANEADGAWILAKVNVDNNQRLSQSYGVQGIPAVKAFRNGSMCEQFTGAIPESQIRTWLKRIIPDASDNVLATLKQLATTNPSAAMHQLTSFIADHPDNAEATLLYASLLVRASDHRADEYLRQIPSHSPHYQAALAWRTLAEGIQSSIVVQSDATAIIYADAMKAIQHNADADAIELLLKIVATNRMWENDLARKTVLALFTVLGETHPLVPAARRQLAALLF